MSTINHYASLLKRPVFVSRREIEKPAQKLLKGVSSRPETRRGRSDERILRDVVPGVAMELAACKATGGYLNSQDFNVHDPMSYIYDIQGPDSSLFEIKTSPRFDKWLNFNLKGYDPNHIKRADYSVFYKYHENIDFLLTGYYSVSEEGFDVQFKFLIDSPSFGKYIKRSKSGFGSTHYYNLPQALKEGACLRLDRGD